MNKSFQFMVGAAIGVAAQFSSVMPAQAQKSDKPMRLINMGQLLPKCVVKENGVTPESDKIVLGPGRLVVVTSDKDTLVIDPAITGTNGSMRIGGVRSYGNKLNLEIVLKYRGNTHFLFSGKSVENKDLARTAAIIKPYKRDEHGPVEFHY